MKICPFFQHFYPMWIKFGAADTHIHASSDACYYENKRKESHILVRAVNEIQSKFFQTYCPIWGKIQYTR